MNSYILVLDSAGGEINKQLENSEYKKKEYSKIKYQIKNCYNCVEYQRQLFS